MDRCAAERCRDVRDDCVGSARLVSGALGVSWWRARRASIRSLQLLDGLLLGRRGCRNRRRIGPRRDAANFWPSEAARFAGPRDRRGDSGDQPAVGGRAFLPCGNHLYRDVDDRKTTPDLAYYVSARGGAYRARTYCNRRFPRLRQLESNRRSPAIPLPLERPHIYDGATFRVAKARCASRIWKCGVRQLLQRLGARCVERESPRCELARHQEWRTFEA